MVLSRLEIHRNNTHEEVTLQQNTKQRRVVFLSQHFSVQLELKDPDSGAKTNHCRPVYTLTGWTRLRVKRNHVLCWPPVSPAGDIVSPAGLLWLERPHYLDSSRSIRGVPKRHTDYAVSKPQRSGRWDKLMRTWTCGFWWDLLWISCFHWQWFLCAVWFKHGIFSAGFCHMMSPQVWVSHPDLFMSGDDPPPVSGEVNMRVSLLTLKGFSRVPFLLVTWYSSNRHTDIHKIRCFEL